MREESYGQAGLTVVDRLGVRLSLRAVRRHLPAGPADVLDLGCGYDARILHALGGRVSHGLGIDVRVSDAARAGGRLAFREGTIEAVVPELPAASRDVVLAISVLEHLWDPLAILGHCHRILRPDGVLLVNVPTWRGRRALELSAFRLGLSPREEMDDHKAYYDTRDLWPLLVRAGFRPSDLRLRRHKLGLNLFAVARRSAEDRSP